MGVCVLQAMDERIRSLLVLVDGRLCVKCCEWDNQVITSACGWAFVLKAVNEIIRSLLVLMDGCLCVAVHEWENQVVDGCLCVAGGEWDVQEIIVSADGRVQAIGQQRSHHDDRNVWDNTTCFHPWCRQTGKTDTLDNWISESLLHLGQLDH